MPLRKCHCGSDLYAEAEYDGQGIFLCYACDRCRSEQLLHFRPEILRPYNQADVDEPIEPE